MPSQRAQNGCEGTKKPQNTDLPTRILNNILYLCPPNKNFEYDNQGKSLATFRLWITSKCQKLFRKGLE